MVSALLTVPSKLVSSSSLLVMTASLLTSVLSVTVRPVADGLLGSVKVLVSSVALSLPMLLVLPAALVSEALTSMLAPSAGAA